MSQHTFDPSVPSQQQDSDYDCSQESCSWALNGWGRYPDDTWMSNDWLAKGIMTPDYGLMDASGAGMAQWVNDVYGPDGMLAESVASVDFDGLVLELDAGMAPHGIAAGGRTFCHWVGVRGYDRANDRFVIANSAPGYMQINQTLDRVQFASLGPWSFVRILWPDAADSAPTPPPTSSYAPPGSVGSGILQMMAEDMTEPAMPSTWLPLATQTSLAEQCWGVNGVQYLWLLAVSKGFRYLPS